MRLQQILGGLAPAEKSALKVLDDYGWALLYDARIDDGWNADGQKRRTFQRRGRCPIVMMRDAEGKHKPTGLFNEPEPEVEIRPEPVRFRPVPWVDEPYDSEPKPDKPAPIVEEAAAEVFEVLKTEVVDIEPEPEPEPKAGRIHHKAKPEVKVKKKHK